MDFTCPKTIEALITWMAQNDKRFKNNREKAASYLLQLGSENYFLDELDKVETLSQEQYENLVDAGAAALKIDT